jgi:hypothetical protein
MTFEHPAALLALLLVPLFALLYLRRAGRREWAVPTLMLWKQAAGEAMAEAGRRLAGFDLRLLLAVLFLVAVILAASGPVLRIPSDEAPSVLLVMDRSASMSTRTASGEPRWQASAAVVRDLLGDLGEGRATVVGLPLAVGRIRRDLDTAEAGSALDEYEPTDLPLDLPAELSRCAGLARRCSVVFVVTDRPDAVPERMASKPVLVVSHGAPSRNVSIDSFELSRTEKGKLAVFVGAAHHGDRTRSVPLSLRVDGRRVPGPTLEIGPGSRQMHVFTLDATGAETVRAALEVDDGLLSDNVATAVRSGERSVRVAYVGRGNPFVEQALGLVPGVELSRFRLTGDLTGAFDLTVYDGAVPDELPAGDVVLIDPPVGIGPFAVRGAVTDPAGRGAVRTVEAPLLEHVEVGGLRFRRVLKMDLTPPARTLVETADGTGAVLARWDDGGRRVTLVGCGLALDETNWPLRSSFPIFWAALVGEAAGREGPAAGVPGYVLTGERVVLRQPPEGTLTVTGPDGGPVSVMAAGGRTYFRPVGAGVYTVQGAGPEQRVAANMLHRTESANSGTAAVPTPEAVESALAPGAGTGIPLWRHLGLAGLLLALGYWARAGRAGR